MSMTIAPEITTRTPASQGKVKQWMHARSVPVIAAAGALAASVIHMVNVLQMVHWSPAHVASSANTNSAPSKWALNLPVSWLD